MLLNYQRINGIDFYKFYLNFEGSKHDEKDQYLVMIIPCREVVCEDELKELGLTNDHKYNQRFRLLFNTELSLLTWPSQQGLLIEFFLS